jgi:hypothetical protein
MIDIGTIARRSARARRTGEAVPPNPSDLIASVREFGYTLPTALADLIDNSLSAGASLFRSLLSRLRGEPASLWWTMGKV